MITTANTLEHKSRHDETKERLVRMSLRSSPVRVHGKKDTEPEYGRPLSIIESVASGEEGASDEERGEEEGEHGHYVSA